MWFFCYDLPLLSSGNMLKKEILRKNEDFSVVYKKGKSVPDRFVVVFYKKNDLRYNRISFLASKKVGNSVQRNRAFCSAASSTRLLNFSRLSSCMANLFSKNTEYLTCIAS